MFTLTQFAKKHKLSRSRVHSLILQGRIKGAKKTQAIGANPLGVWVIPESAKIEKLK